MKNRNQLMFLKVSFFIGAVADGVVGVNWLLISLGYEVPNLISSYAGSGTDYRFAMYIGTLFMFGWAAILLWGYFKPFERSDLLLITAILLAVSILIELLFYAEVLKGAGFISGVIARLLIICKFSFSYFYSLKKE